MNIKKISGEKKWMVNIGMETYICWLLIHLTSSAYFSWSSMKAFWRLSLDLMVLTVPHHTFSIRPVTHAATVYESLSKHKSLWHIDRMCEGEIIIILMDKVISWPIVRSKIISINFSSREKNIEHFSTWNVQARQFPKPMQSIF